VRLKAASPLYVSRGGLKIQGAAEHFGLEIEGRVCVDIGSSTGGFTHYLLLHDAARVYAVDVDVTQLDYRLQQDPRVVLVERKCSSSGTQRYRGTRRSGDHGCVIHFADIAFAADTYRA
jgi:predicted rRNA methylase YqxC with S4 and FtsJ domains